MKFTQTRISFCVKLTDAQWRFLDKRDRSNQEIHDIANHPKMKALSAAGVENMEWSGHFGQAFYFDCTPENVDKAQQAVRSFFAKR